jgi:large subunit ribosomal protein L29e
MNLLKEQTLSYIPKEHSAKKQHKKGLKKMQADNSKAMSAHAEATKALLKPKEANKHKILKGANCKLQ